MSRLPTLILALLLFSILVLTGAVVSAEGPNAQNVQSVQVGVVEGEPFVIPNGDHYSGFSIDYWEKIAEELGVAYNYVPFQSEEEMMAAVQNQTVDLALGVDGMTAEQEKALDLTHSYLTSGLQILTLPASQQAFLGVFTPILAPAVFQVFALALVFSIIMAHVIYFVERRSNPEFQQGYLRDIWEAFWYLLIIVATGEYGDKEARAPIKRVVTVVFWLLGVLFIAQFTAAASSALTVQQLTGSINGPDDLAGRRVITVEDSDAADYMKDNRIAYTQVANPEEAYRRLADKQADAFVFEAPTVRYYATHEGRGKVALAGAEFAREPIGIALPMNSTLRKPINEIILRFNDDGTYEEIYNKWLGELE